MSYGNHVSILVRLYTHHGLKPGWIGFWSAFVLIACFLLFEYTLDRYSLFTLPDLEDSVLRNFRITIIHLLTICYLPAAYVLVILESLNTQDKLASRLRLSDQQIAELKNRIGNYSWLTMIVGCIGANLLFVYLTFATTPESNPWALEVMSIEVWWHRVLTPLMSIFVFIFLQAIMVESKHLSELSSKFGDLDVVDLEFTRIFGQNALKNSLLILGWLAIISLFLMEEGFGSIILAGWVTIVVIVVAAFLGPVLGIREQIVMAKKKELDWCDANIKKSRDQFKKQEIIDKGGPTPLGELIVYRQYVDDLSEWPFDVSTVLRLLLYLLIPLISWFGGALVERSVDTLLG
jgi:hypothetical protein